MPTKFSKVVAAGVLLLSLACLASPAQADTILTIDGTIARFQLVPGGATFTLQFQDGDPTTVDAETTQFNGARQGPYPTILKDLILSATPTSVPGGIEYSFSPTDYPAGQTITGLPRGMFNDGIAVFNLKGISALTSSNPLFAKAIILTGTMQLDKNLTTTTLDFSLFEPTSDFIFTLNTATGSFNYTIQQGNSLSGSGSFSELDRAPTAPEPASVLLLAAAGVTTGLCYGWRRLRRIV